MEACLVAEAAARARARCWAMTAIERQSRQLGLPYNTFYPCGLVVSNSAMSCCSCEAALRSAVYSGWHVPAKVQAKAS